MKKTRLLSGKEQERMINNGWWLCLPEPLEGTEAMRERLSEKYSQVKMYYVTTAIRGFYKPIAMVKK